MKKVIFALICLIFIASAGDVFAETDTKTSSAQPQGSVFQQASDTISGIERPESINKDTIPKTFQKSHDYIVKSSPKARQLSLRGNTEEIKRRRGSK